jgi:hypothetical protein
LKKETKDITRGRRTHNIRNSSRLSPSDKQAYLFTWGKARGVSDGTHNSMFKRTSTKGQIMIYKTLHRTLKIVQQKPHSKLEIISDAPEGYAMPAPLVPPVVLLSNDTNIINVQQ